MENKFVPEIHISIIAKCLAVAFDNVVCMAVNQLSNYALIFLVNDDGSGDGKEGFSRCHQQQN